MKIGIDIGGCISKYPDQFRWLINSLSVNMDIYVITDMHDKEEVIRTLKNNGFEIPDHRVYCADYAKYGEFCKAKLLQELQIDMLIDDFAGYLAWDSSFGPAPMRLLMMPDPHKPYWDDSWKVETESDFGRRKFVDGTP